MIDSARQSVWFSLKTTLFLLGLTLLALPVQAQQDLFERVGPGLTGITEGSSSVGDVNNDGNKDIFILGNPATLYLGNGQGGFTKANAGIVARRRSSSSLGDVDNDGNLDLLIVGGEATLYLGNGQGGFTEASAGLKGVDYASTSIGDVDGDGNPDVLIAGLGVINESFKLITRLYLGDGQGEFTRAEASLTGVSHGSTSIGDFNNDDNPDLLITGDDGSGPTTTLYLGDGQGGFEKAEAGLTGVTSSSISLGDVDDDGNLDFLLTGKKEIESTTTLYLGDGQGSFTEADAGLTGILNGASSIKDLDEDGNLDVIVAGNVARARSFDPQPGAILYLGDGSGGFNEADAGLQKVLKATVSIGDVVGDESLDLLITGSEKGGDASATIYRGDGEGGFTSVGPNLTGVSLGSSSFGDVDEDGNLDLLTTGSPLEGEPRTTLYLGNGQGDFTEANADLVGGEYTSIGDLNNDGNLDFVITGDRGGAQETARLYLGDGQGGFTEANAELTGVRYGASSSIGDVNKDGNPDLLITGFDGDAASATLYLGGGQGGFTEAGAGLTGVQKSASAFGDVNNDGNLDLVITGSINGENSTTLYLGDGQGGFTKTNAGLTDVNEGSVSIGDVDNDGNLDLLLTGGIGVTGSKTALYLGNGQGGFTEAFADLSDVRNSSSTIGDVNSDGNLDLVIAGGPASSSESVLYLGDGRGGFTKAEAGLTGLAFSSSALGDVDNDGHLDLVITGDTESSGPASLLYENRSSGDFLAASASQSVSSSGQVDFSGTGVGVTFSGVSGSGQVTVQKFSNGPRGSRGVTESNVSGYRFVLNASGSLSFDSNTEVRLDVGSVGGISAASNVTVYKRSPRGAGIFSGVSTSYDSNANELVATTGSFSEFVLASNSEPLPVEMAGFEARVEEDKVRLNWQTASETNNAGFAVQRRAGGEPTGSWEKIGFVESKTSGGTTTEAKSYRYVDTNLPYAADRLVYRLKQVDTDGSAHFSKEVTVERGVAEVQLLGTYPNPARTRATIRYALPEKQDVTIRLYDVLGRAVRTVVNGTAQGRHKQAMDVGTLPNGAYFLRLKTGGTVKTQKLTVVR